MSIDAFDHILLSDTFVLAWHQGPESLTFHVLASLLRTHPNALPPIADDWACYRPGIIQFSGVSSVDGLLRQDSAISTKDPDGSIDYGCIDDLSLIRMGEYRIAGEFGVVTVVARDVSLILGAAA